MRRAAKRDKSEAAIIQTLEAVGATVAQISGHNVPDLAVGFRGVNYLLEVKTGKYGKLTAGQRQWHQNWEGQVATVRTAEEALEAIGAL